MAQVPFVDVVTTMLDETLPSPLVSMRSGQISNEEESFNYMLSLLALRQRERRRSTPNMLITGGINDSQVLFHEPAKWTAKLRS